MRLAALMLGVACLTIAATRAADFEEVTAQDIVFASIPAGTFTMGTTDEVQAELQAAGAWTRFEEVERPAHTVRISKPFLMGKFEVTQKQWTDVMGARNPSAFKVADRPVETVSWDDVKIFIAALNKKERRSRFRLPTEAEWEYCCRAGSGGAYGLGKDKVAVTAKSLGDYAWFSANAGSKTQAAGAKLPNAWGLHDMQGNVWEWCQDWYTPTFYTAESATDPMNSDAQNSTERVIRGGSWFLAATSLRAASRGASLPDAKSAYIGFRLVCEP
ncbi:MAG: formylglycine-generating enzyme family protein [Chthoniobacteraceae bacterium]